MTDSLVLGGLYELVGDASNPEYRLLVDSDLGAPEPDTETITGILLDGDRVTGLRSGNREVTLPVRVTGNDRSDLAYKVNLLLQVIDAQDDRSFPLQWTPDGAAPLVLDGFRGGFARTRDLRRERGIATVVTLKFPAAPFGRSATVEQVSTVSSTLQLDALNSAVTGGTLDTSVHYEGSGSNRVTMTKAAFRLRDSGFVYQYYMAAPLSHSISPQDVSAYSSVSVRFRWPAPANGSLRYYNTSFTLTLGDGTETQAAATLIGVPVGGTDWILVSVPVASFADLNPDLDLTAITSWSVSATTAQVAQAGGGPAATSNAWFDDVRAFPSASTSITTAEGAVLTIPAVKGTARAPVNLVVDRAGGAMTGLLVHKPPIGQPPGLPIIAALGSHPPIAGDSATLSGRFDGTYAVVLLMAAVPTAGGELTVTVGGTTFDETFATADINGRFLVIGEVTLPAAQVPLENTTQTTSVIVDVISGFTGFGSFTDVMLCDTRGPTWLLPTLASATAVYFDEPDPTVDIGQVYASTSDRSAAVSVMAGGLLGGGPLVLDPGDDQLLLASPEGVPEGTIYYHPRWLDEVGVASNTVTTGGGTGGFGGGGFGE